MKYVLMLESCIAAIFTWHFPPFLQGNSSHLLTTLISQFLPVKPMGQEQV